MSEEKNLLEGYDPKAPPKPKPSQEQLSEAAASIDLTPVYKPKAPGWMWVTQGLAIIYVLVNILFVVGLTASRSPSTGIVAAYMLPLTILLVLLIDTIRQLKEEYLGEKK